MSDPSSYSPPNYHPLFNKKEPSPETNMNLYFISSIWDDDLIERLGDDKWKCIWCDDIF